MDSAEDLSTQEDCNCQEPWSEMRDSGGEAGAAKAGE
jgi:hypothetical protein